MLELKQITKVYSTGSFEQKALNSVSLKFRESEFTSILGPSGSGKTTLLNIIGGLDDYTSGDLIIDGISTKEFRDSDWDSYRNHRIGFVFQSYNLISHQSILNNVRLALTLSGISKREGTKRAKQALNDVGLGEHIHKRPLELSGGQMQRVAIARALVNDPDILLADEPTGALDSETSLQIMKLLKEISKTKLVIMVTHNADLAKEYSTRIIELKDGKITSDSNNISKKMPQKNTQDDKKKTKKTKMSFITALMLSLNNLLTKKKRTILVSIAGSIGIVGIALILAVSTGFQNYIDSIQEETLSAYPLMIMEQSFSMKNLLMAPENELKKATSLLEESNKDVVEYQFLANTLRSVATNDLKSFKNHLEDNSRQYENDVTSIDYNYSIDPLIYTIDGTNKLAKLNPNNMFSSMFGGSELMSSFSNYASVFSQMTDDRETLEKLYELKAGRWPENYNEMVIVLTSEHAITDMLAYSLGLKDTSELSTMITKLMSGESFTVNSESIMMNYEDFLDLDMRLILPFNLYKYNEKYGVYEDMSSDEKFMEDAYENAVRLKISGVVYPKKGSTSVALQPGVGYTSALTHYIINSAEESDAVKKQLSDQDVDVFSGNNFNDKTKGANLSFENLISVDTYKLRNAFSFNIDENAIKDAAMKEVRSAIDEMKTNIEPAKKDFKDTLEALSDGAKKFIEDLREDTESKGEEFNPTPEEMLEYVKSFLATYEPSVMLNRLEEIYKIPKEKFSKIYSSLITFIINGGDPAGAEVEIIKESFAGLMTEVKLRSDLSNRIQRIMVKVSNEFAKGFNVDPSAITSAFSLNFTEDELKRVVSAMITNADSSAKSNLLKLGYQDRESPTYISIYFASFEGKEHFISFIDEYNKAVEKRGEKDKVINYSDTTGILMNTVKVIVDAVSYVLIAFVSISLVVSSIMIGIITYISVYERKKEIGILRAIGASKHNVSNIFNAETFIIGFLAGLFGIAISYTIIPIINTILAHVAEGVNIRAALNPEAALILVGLSIVLTLLGGLIPARSAAKHDPVEALRSE